MIGGITDNREPNTDDGTSRLLYYIENDTSVVFSYNAVNNPEFDGDGNGNFGQLGLNGYDLDESGEEEVAVKTAALYDAHEYSMSSQAEYVKISVRLSKKTDYSQALDNLTYLHNFKLLDNMGNEIVQTADDPLTENTDETVTVIKNNPDNIYVYIVPKSMLESSENIYSIPVQFSVYSGNNDTFERRNGVSYDMEYSNYKVQITAGLLENRTDAASLPNSDKTDHIIYTNARLYSEVIS